MPTATATILDSLTAVLADVDAADLAKEIEWARGRKAALDAYRATDDYATTMRSFNTFR